MSLSLREHDNGHEVCNQHFESAVSAFSFRVTNMAETTNTQESIDDQVFADSPSDAGKLHQDLAEANEKALRVQAELENYRKRARREMEEERRYALLPFAKDLLTVVDNLERALAVCAD